MRAFAPGDVVAGYRIESLVGRGGMGVVYRAREVDLDRVIALKVIAPDLVEDDVVRARFLREARAAAAIEHPHVIPIHATGEAGGVAFLAMRFVEGDDLRSRVRRDGSLTLADAAGTIEQAAAGLDAIHLGGFVHRDVKPANLLLDRSGHVYVTDFGLAKRTFTRGGGTSTDQWVGTLDYVAPEQIRGGRVDARADVYGLGGVLHFALTGHVPFEREGDEAKLWAQLSEPPPRPSRWRPETPEAVDAVVARAMAKSPDVRFPSAGDLSRALLAAVGGVAVPQRERMVARGAAAPAGAETEPGLAPEASTVTAPRDTQLLPVRRRPRRAVLVGGLAALAGGGALLAVLMTGREEPPPAERREARGAAATAAPPAPEVAHVTPNVGLRPGGIAFAAGDLWVASHRETRLTRIDAATGLERAQHPHVGLGVVSIAADRDTLWVARREAGRVLRIDARTGRVTRRIRVPAQPSEARGRRHGAVDLTSLGASAAAASALRPRRAPLALEPRPPAHRPRAGRRRRRRLARGPRPAGRDAPRPRDAQDHGGGSPPRGAGHAHLRRRRPVGRAADGGHHRAHRASQRAQVTSAAGHRPTQAVHAGGRVFVASSNDHDVLLFDAETAEQVGEPIRVGRNPSAMATDGRSVWVTSLAENTVTRIVSVR